MPLLDDNGWREYQKLVLDKLDAHSTGFRCLNEKMTRVRVEIAALKIKSGLWGAAAGVLPALAVLLYTLLQGK